MNDKQHWRLRARGVLQAYFEKRSFPRLALSLVVALTGCVGFLISFGLLQGGVDAMWIRYPVAVIGAYTFFLVLLKLWVEVERARFKPEEIEKELVLSQGSSSTDRPSVFEKVDEASDWLSWLDVSGGDYFDDGCLPVLLLGGAVGVVALLAVTIFSAPILIAEVFLDTFLVAMLYRRLKIASNENWLSTAIRKTWKTTALIAGLLMFCGWCLQYLSPESRSIGPAMKAVWENSTGTEKTK